MAQSTSLSVDERLSQSRIASALFGGDPKPVDVGPYRLVRRIGAGGMGVVFEAIHGETGQRLALKMLQEAGFGAMQRLKREFRVLSDLHHPNLVRFHELSLDAATPYLTMELIDGQSVFDHVRPGGLLTVTRVRSVLCQLVEAVDFLHAQGVVHRDLKPSNLLVTRDGRLVVLDFGLARLLDAEESGSTSGTPRYMAPERLWGMPADEASDWYSVGAIMSETLAGTPWVCSSPGQAEPLHSNDPTLHALTALCTRLVAPEPTDRPRADELREALGLSGATRATHPLRVFDDSVLFVGRDAELATLRCVFAGVCTDQAAIVLLHGEPGIGKTALARRFLADQGTAQNARVLTGRCYESELIPYNAFDGVMEGLASIVARLRDDERSRIARFATPELLRLFPALQPAFARGATTARTAGDNATDVRSLRERAFAALRDLLRALAKQQPLVMHLDDLQWGDRDSAELLSELFIPSGLERVLLLVGFRTSDAAHSPCLQILRQPQARATSFVTELQLNKLDDSAALELVSTLGGARFSRQELLDLSREAAGSPLFLRALIEAQPGAGRSSESLLGMAALLHAALSQLSPAEREYLELVALCGRPVARDLLLQVGPSVIGQQNVLDALSALKHMALIRSVPGQALECLHDRVRELVVEQLPDLRRTARHLALAQAAEQCAERDPEFLAFHYRGAGRLSDAALHAQVAGDRAFAAFAFENAVRLYTLALRCLEGSRPPLLLEKLADANASTGRCGQAAPLYLEASQSAKLEKVTALRLRAAQTYFQAGDRAQGWAVTDLLLRSAGVRPARTPIGKFVSAYTRLLWLRTTWRLDLARRRGGSSPAERLRADICFTLGQSLHTIDPPLATLLILHMLPSALRDESEGRRARALAYYAAFLAMLHLGSRSHQDQLFDRASELAARSTEPDTRHWVLFLRTITAHNRTQFAQALRWIQLTSRDVDDRCIESRWLRDELILGTCAMLVLTGRLQELTPHAQQLERLTFDSGNVLHYRHMRAQLCFLWLAQGAPDKVRHEVLQHPPPERAEDMGQVDAFNIWLHVHLHLFSGDNQAAFAEIEARWPLLKAVGYPSLDPWATGLHLVRATAALACLGSQSERAANRCVRASLNRLRRHPGPFATPAARLIEAGLLHARGDLTAAAPAYGVAADAFESASMLGYAAAARSRQAELTGGRRAETLRARAEHWFSAQQILDARAWVRMHAPVGG
jgi:hypothetical protein